MLLFFQYPSKRHSSHIGQPQPRLLAAGPRLPGMVQLTQRSLVLSDPMINMNQGGSQQNIHHVEPEAYVNQSQLGRYIQHNKY